MKILKFGGSSLAAPDRVRRVIQIIRESLDSAVPSDGATLAVVVSALGGVTDDLLAAAAAAARRDDAYEELRSALEERHRSMAAELAGAEHERLAAELGVRFDDLRDLLHGAYLLREHSRRTRDGVLAYGERLSALILAAALRSQGIAAEACDAREIIVTDDNFGCARVDLDESFERIRAALKNLPGIAVVTGFTGASCAGQTTTLGRGGSDYTAALLGAAVDAEVIELWTDVDGVMSADPRLVAEAFVQPGLSYAELMELSHFGAKVVYPPTIHPARSRRIPLVIKNTFNPEAPGTRVEEVAPESAFAARGISSINRVALMRLEGDGMVGVPGIAMRLFGALARRQVSVILISQGSSEHSICFAVAPEDAEPAVAAVGEEFALERQAGIVDELVVEDDQSVIAAVGEQMRERPGIAGRLFGILGEHGISIRALAQGSSELNISLVVAGDDEAAALGAMHGAIFFPRRRRLAIALAGPGRVGAELIAQLARHAAELAQNEHLELRLVALADSRRLVLDRDGIDLADWRRRLDAASELDPQTLQSFLSRPSGEARIFVDCTASDAVTGWYAGLLERQVAVVAANKLAFAGPADLYDRLRQGSRASLAPLLFEATVGAGLPVLSTLEGLRRTGHRVERIEGVLSGTVNAVLDRLAAGEAFSQAVRGAHADGLTEPRPYEDLCGGDVVRKLTILARGSGHSLEARDVDVEPLLPAQPWSTMDLATFWNALPDLDDEYGRRQEEAAAAGCRLRYVASLSPAASRVKLEAVASDHPAYSVAGADNLIAFTTQHYGATPLVIRGPGAGPAVTASGVFADVLRAADLLEHARR